MFTLSTILVFVGFFIAYNTSKRAVLQANPIITSIVRQNVGKAKIISVLLLFAALTIVVSAYGLGSGVLFFCLILMLVASCVVLLQPLQLLKYPVLIVLFLIGLCVDFLMFAN